MQKNVDMDAIFRSRVIFFGPFVGELGWELFRWSGFIRWFKQKHPNKKIIVATRSGREDLYYGVADKIHTFDIPGDYKSRKPNMYRMDGLPEPEYQKLLNGFTAQHRNALVVEAPRGTNNRNVFRRNLQNFRIAPHPDNTALIRNLTKKKGSKKIISISPRKRTDLVPGGRMHTRNWAAGHWEELFELISESNEYLGIVLGRFPTFIRPPTSLKNLIVLEDHIEGDNVTAIGATVATIKSSVLTVGQHSAIPLLSNYIKVPTLMWGEDRQRHTVAENPFNTPCLFIDDKAFNIAAGVVFSYLNRIVKGK